MLKTVLLILTGINLLTGCNFPSSTTENDLISNKPPVEQSTEQSKPDNNMIPINIQVNNQNFTASFYDNETTRALIKKFPMTIEMDELNNNEKKYNLPESLPSTSTERPFTINEGEIMCWSGNVLVLFYKTFPNSYGGYVKLGVVDNPTKLSSALGNSSCTVTWSLK